MKSKRFMLSALALVGNFIVFYAGIQYGSDLIGLGTGLALVNTPALGYMAAETYRPSGVMSEGQTVKPKA